MKTNDKPSELELTLYKLAHLYQDKALLACAAGQPDVVHYFVTEARRAGHQVRILKNRFGEV